MDNFYKNLLKSCLDTPKSGNTTSWDTVLGMKPGSSFEHSKIFYILGPKSVLFWSYFGKSSEIKYQTLQLFININHV